MSVQTAARGIRKDFRRFSSQLKSLTNDIYSLSYEPMDLIRHILVLRISRSILKELWNEYYRRKNILFKRNENHKLISDVELNDCYGSWFFALTTLGKCVHLHKVLWYSNSRYVDNTRTFAFSNLLLREVDGTCCNKISGVLSDNCNETGGPCFIFYADVMHKMLTIIDLDIGSVKPFTNCHNASFSSYFTYQFEVAAVRYYCSFIADLLYKCLNGIGCCMMYCYCIYRADIMYKLLSIIDLQWLIFWCECISYKLFWVTSIIIYLFSWLSWILMIMSSNFLLYDSLPCDVFRF